MKTFKVYSEAVVQSINYNTLSISPGYSVINSLNDEPESFHMQVQAIGELIGKKYKKAKLKNKKIWMLFRGTAELETAEKVLKKNGYMTKRESKY